ncbi:serine/threonine protein kinase [Elasticomyces elasticus]|nr:serine/threonine protein kinase [Elasticomyces elasticus]KAK3640287.1 serine/threonine protein kinase [Elasticomyces elasticus]KAK4920564.1 serine/threonine protein kinase [Elasticomyces elasticus]
MAIMILGSSTLKTISRNPSQPAYMGKGSDIIILFSIILTATSSWFWPRSEQSPQRNADLETGLSQGYGTFDEVHDADPEAPQPIPQLLHVTKRAKPFNPAPSSFYYRPASLPSRRATSSPPQSMLLEPPTTSQDEDDQETSPPAAEYQTLHTFGESGEGQVRVVKQKSSPERFVIKTLRTRTRKDGTIKMPNEVAMLKLHLDDHPNIIHCHTFGYESTPDNTFCHMVLEYCSGGDLFDFCAHWRKLKRYQEGMFVPEIFLLHFLTSMADALDFLHLKSRVIHRDIKLGNVLLRWSPRKLLAYDIVLADLGYSCYEHESYGVCGTKSYLPEEVKAVWNMRHDNPEALDRKYMSYGSDIFCLGAILYDLIFDDAFDNTHKTYSPDELAQRFRQGPYTRSPWMLNILTGCLAEDPKDRLTTAELVHAAKGMKAALRAMGDAGVRMPANSWPTMQLDCDRVQAPPQPSEHTSAGAGASDEAPVAGSSESFRVCWCENHGAMSLRKPKLGCETSQSMTYRPRPGARAIVSEEAAGAGAGVDQTGQLVACAA